MMASDDFPTSGNGSIDIAAESPGYFSPNLLPYDLPTPFAVSNATPSHDPPLPPPPWTSPQSHSGFADSRHLIRKAEEYRCLSDVQFDSSVIGVGEVAKAIICLELAASRFDVVFDRQFAMKMSGMSEKAYMRSLNSMQNGICFKPTLDVRELGIQFGCVRLIPFVKDLAFYKERFLAALPPSRRPTTDFNRQVFIAATFYLCVKTHKLKVDRLRLIELCGTSESEFATVSNLMSDLCFDVVGASKEKKNPKAVKGHRELLDALPSRRRREDDSDASDYSSANELSSYKRHKMEKQAYEKWKVSVISSNKQEEKASLKPKKQATLNFKKKSSSSVALEAL